MKENKFKIWLERFNQSKVLWKQTVIVIAQTILGFLVLAKIIDQAQLELWMTFVVYAVGGIVSILVAFYNLYSGGNNSADTEKY